MRQRSVNNPYRITTVFGNVPGYPLNNGFHTGTDYVSDDKLIVAPMDSVVVAINYDDKNGNYLVLEKNGYRDWFSHIASYRVSVGQAVTKGQPLAVMGRTGQASGVHNHHSLRVNGVLVDPELYITKGNTMNTKERVQAVFRSYLQREATPQEITYWVGRPNIELDDNAAAARFATDATNLRNATNVAEVRAGYVAQLCNAAGVDPNQPLEQPQVSQAVTNIDAKNKQIEALSQENKFVPLGKEVFIKEGT
jgi:hypothetical protein